MLHQQKPCQLSVCGYYRFNGSTLRVTEKRIPPTTLNFRTLLQGNRIPMSSVITDRAMLLNAGGFHPEHHEDYGLWLRLFAAAHPPAYCCLPEPLMAYRLHPHSISAARHRSLLAVNELFRQHIPSRKSRWTAVARWGLDRFCNSHGLLKEQLLGHSQLLPNPFRALIGPDSQRETLA